MQGTVFNIQRFSIHDGPGIRTNVFLKGCPLNCLWCHNPEGLSNKPQVKYSPLKCIGCGDCVKVCEPKGHQLRDGVHTLDFSKCIGCLECARICPAGAMESYGEAKSVEDIIAEVMRDAAYYKTSGGGLTLSGGEPLYQGEFAVEILKAAKEKGIHTAVETCGMVSEDVIRAAAEYVDLFLYDYKITGEEKHKEMTGASQKQILSNLSMLDSMGCEIILRCPIIPGINDDDNHYHGIADIANKYKNIKEINIMPYHTLGNSKREKLGMDIKYETHSMKMTEAEAVRDIIQQYTSTPVRVS
ncbi:MAG: glycyl-radical enzyme activating protein [Clostridia bacterium]|nr:glycyl-radical enzyme activating protein [Clostridia bacterium]